MTNNFTVAFLPAYLMSTSYILRLYIPPNLKVKIGPTNRYAYCRTDLCINYSIPYGSAFSLLDYAGRINWAHLVKCRQHRNGIFIPFRLFQSTSSVWRTTAPSQGLRPHFLFQSTSSVWRTTTATNTAKAGLIIISIHVLRVEDDPAFQLPDRARIHFNPRPPCGGRLDTGGSIMDDALFQSTSSVWRTTPH